VTRWITGHNRIDAGFDCTFNVSTIGECGNGLGSGGDECRALFAHIKMRYVLTIGN
jgi:hypothetical protein